jgi:hypothetical protein
MQQKLIAILFLNWPRLGPGPFLFVIHRALPVEISRNCGVVGRFPDICSLFMATSKGLLFTFDEHQRPVSAICPYCGEEMPPPDPGQEAPLAAVFWGALEFLKHRSLKHPESSQKE